MKPARSNSWEGEALAAATKLSESLRGQRGREPAAAKVVTGDEEQKVRDHVKAKVEDAKQRARQRLLDLKQRAETKQERHEPRTSRR